MKLQCIKKWAWSIFWIAAVWKGFDALSCMAVAHADIATESTVTP